MDYSHSFMKDVLNSFFSNNDSTVLYKANLDFEGYSAWVNKKTSRHAVLKENLKSDNIDDVV